MIPVPPSNATPTAAIARVDVPLEERGPLSWFENAAETLPASGDVVAEVLGDGEFDREAGVGDVGPGGVGAIGGLDLRTTIPPPHMPQSGNGASAPCRWQE